MSNSRSQHLGGQVGLELLYGRGEVRASGDVVPRVFSVVRSYATESVLLHESIGETHCKMKLNSPCGDQLSLPQLGQQLLSLGMGFRLTNNFEL